MAAVTFDIRALESLIVPEQAPAMADDLWGSLRRVGELCSSLASQSEAAQAERDELIRALSTQGASRRAVAGASGLTVGRVQQIVAAGEAKRAELSTDGGHLAAVRRESDRLAAAGRGDRLRRRRLPAEDAEALVAAAVNLAKQGDEDALQFLYLRYADNIYGYICSLVRDEREAEDLTHQTFATLHKELQRGEPRSAPFLAWILRIAHNKAIDTMRGRDAVPQEGDRSSELNDVDQSRERARDLHLALDALPAGQRDVIIMRFVMGMSCEDVGERLGSSNDTVRSLEQKGREALRRELTRLRHRGADTRPAMATGTQG